MRSLSMQALTDAVKRRKPGVVVYGKGDAAHALRVSGHNEDDTPGVRAEQSDADSIPEHRAIDIMLGPAFTKADAYELIEDLLADQTALARLIYFIFDGHIWSKSRDWVKREFDGDNHSDHIHLSGDADDDENAAPWPAAEGDDMTPAELLGTRLGRSDVTVAQALQETERNVRGLATAVDALAAKVDALAARPPADVDEQALADALAPLLDSGATPEEVAAAVLAQLAAKLA